MNISYNWLKEYLDIDLQPEEVVRYIHRYISLFLFSINDRQR